MMRLGLRSKIILIVLGAMLLAMGITASAFGVLYARQQTEVIESRSLAIAKGLALQLERIVALGLNLRDLHGFEEQCREVLSAYEGLSYAMVVSEGRILFHNEDSKIGLTLTSPALISLIKKGEASTIDPRDDMLVARAPVDTYDVTAAHVIVGYPRMLLQRDRNTLLMISLGIGFSSVGLCLLLLYFSLSHYVLAPIQRFIRTTEDIRSGRASYEVRLPLHGEIELDTMMQAFNSLLDEIAQRERQLLIASEAAKTASRAKSDFLAVMSHEIRTPIHAVLGMTELMQGTELNDKQRRYITRIYEASGMLLNQVNEVLDFAKAESGELKILRVPFDLKQSIHDKVEVFSELARKKGVALALVLAEDLPETALGDPYRLGQIITNLLSNALKFTETGRIDIEVSRYGRFIRIQVRDTGCGIQPHLLGQIFEPFRQADNSPSRQYGGSGLGLAIVRHLTEAMGGTVNASSIPGQGSCFQVQLDLPAVSSSPPSVTENPT